MLIITWNWFWMSVAVFTSVVYGGRSMTTIEILGLAGALAATMVASIFVEVRFGKLTDKIDELSKEQEEDKKLIKELHDTVEELKKN